MSRWGMGQPCMCGGCPDCLRAQGFEPCPDCGAFGGCDCEEGALAAARDQQEAEPDVYRCPDCDYEIGPDLVCSACAQHERHREISRREMESLAQINAMNRRLAEPKPETRKE